MNLNNEFKPNNEHKPIWLNLKKEYIDDNLESLIKYLSTNRALQYPDPFYQITLNLFHERVMDVLNDQIERPLYKEDDSPEVIAFNIRILAAFLLCFPEDYKRRQIFISLITHLCLLVPKTSESLLTKALDCMRHEIISNPGFSFHDISNFKAEIFAHLIIDHVEFASLMPTPMLWEKHGRAWLSKDGLMLTSTGIDRSEEMMKLAKYSSNLPLASDLCSIGTPTKEKLKKADRITLAELNKFLRTFTDSQNKDIPVQKIPTLLSYADGDECIVKITDITYFGHIHVETVDSAYKKLRGEILFYDDYISALSTAHIHRYLMKGDRIKVCVKDADNGIFNFENQLLTFLVEDTRENIGEDNSIPAQLLSYTEKFYNWIAANGVMISTFNVGGFQRGDLAELKITKIEDRDNYGKIVGEVIEPISQDMIFDEYGQFFDSEKIRRSTMEAFVDSTPQVEENPENALSYQIKPLTYKPLRLLIRLLYTIQRNLPNPTDRFIYLLYAIIMATMIEDQKAVSFLNFTATYLRAVVRFATDEGLEGIDLMPDEDYADSAPVILRLKVVEILKEYGVKGISDILEEAENDPNSVISSLARLVQAANAVAGVLSSSTLNVIKREIIRTLSIETEDSGSLVADDRPYIGQEGETMEFKSSIVFPPDNNMQADVDMQTINVFKPVCAFLNSRLGGTIYLGVNDNGYVRGLDDDKHYLRVKSIDEYTRKFIQDPIIREFGKEVIPYVHISPAYEDDVVVIKVEPHPYRVVELRNIAYARYNNETREMAETERQAIVKRRRFTDKSRIAAILALQHASFAHNMVRLKSYVSAETGKVTDRIVEPYEVMPDDDLVACYDIEEGKCDIFKISRLSYVEPLDKTWENADKHIPFEVDAFHTTGPDSYKIDLELDLLAKNILLESYPATKPDIQPCKGDPTRWYYSGIVRNLEGIGRFYMGMADHIKILSGNPLKRYVASRLEVLNQAVN